MHFELAFVLVFAVATAVAIAARYFKFPYTVALVVAGVLLGAFKAFEPPHLTKDLLFAIILPGLLFEAAFHVEFRKFWKNKLAIHAMAIPGLVAAAGLTAFFLTRVVEGLHFVQGFGMLSALVFASVIVSTDPIAVVALFKSLGAPKRLLLLVEGESLLNDGAAVVLFTLIVATATGSQFTMGGALFNFIKVFGMGVLVGSAVGYAVSQVIKRVDDAMVEITLTVIAAYGSFVVAEHFHYSGVIATVVAGMLCGNWASHQGMSPATRIAVASFWEYLAFALNSVVFLLIGLEVHLGSLLASWKPILVAYVVVLVARALVVYGVSALLRFTSERIPWAWSAVLTWSGLRGAISMVLVLGLPSDFAHRELLVNMTFGVVVLSIVFQGLTMAPLLRKLRITGLKDEFQEQYELARGRLGTIHAALAALEGMRRTREIPGDVAARLEKDYQEKESIAEKELAALKQQSTRFHEEEHQEAIRRVLMVEKASLLKAYQSATIGKESFERLTAELDDRIAAADAAESHVPADEGAPASAASA
ncbi:Na+/H+ antiporter [Myxococcus sp. AM009]|uniref:Na+/H+ antiporter n=1 Tax=unclassified Myxococcus TaxID=2648731 RepID=UPI0015950F34|nr:MULTISPECIES: Na+/H+ antiporter [unclassified Myxococcus]NVI98021.1 Na+/H+ antiporter [Myxococcus sp. AM009]NVJ15662.1 Na+/H+ antiporter [Myxococcus sp. AM010]